MPTYEYACDACGHRFEEYQSIKANPITVCPVCKKKKVKRLISAGAGFIFKGSGFYTTDYRSDAYKTSAKNDVPKTQAAKTETGKTGTSPTAAAKSDGQAAPAKTESPPPAAPKPPQKASSHAKKGK